MDERSPSLPVSLFRCGRLALHLFHAVLLAIFYPHLNQTKRRRILKTWSRQLLDILNIGIRTEGPWPVRGEGGFLIVANHVSWLDIFVLNSIYPARFIAKAEVRNWPLIGWLCKCSNTIFIERAMRQDAASINRHVSRLLEQGVCEQPLCETLPQITAALSQIRHSSLINFSHSLLKLPRSH